MNPLVLAGLVDAQASSRSSLTTRIVNAVIALFRRFDGWYSNALVTEISGQVGELVLSGTRGVAAVTDAYLSRAASEIIDASIAPVGVEIVGPLRLGVPDLASVYERVVKEYRYQVSTGVPDAAALGRALERADAMVQTDMALAHRDQARKFMAVNRVDGFRRIIRPERSEGGTCGLCVVAADRTYHRDDLLPIHDRCNCTVLPILNGVDPGLSLNREDLDAFYEAAGGTTSGRALKNVRVTTYEHGELGPILVNAGHRHRTPADVARDLRDVAA